ncbi:MAG: hypothetical protein LAT84_05405 [Balneolia bacterium]|nr:hypothetical protein [Balneolia bacterium]
MYIFIIFLLISALEWPDRIDLQPGEESSTIRSLALCGDRFFTVDNHLKSINSFSKNGEFIKSYSSLGQGPGDFNEQNGAHSIHCLEKGNVMVIDIGNRVLFFDKDLNHIETLIVERPPGMSAPFIQSLLNETETHYYFSANLVNAYDHSSVLVVNRETFKEEETLGPPLYTDHMFLRRHNTYFDHNSEYFLSYNRFVGLVIPYKYGSNEYGYFKIQDHMSLDFFEQHLPEIPRQPSDFEAVGLMDGPVILSITIFKNQIYLIQDRFANEPRSYIDIYDFEGNQKDQIPNKHEIISFAILDGALYGYNPDDFELFLIESL